MNIDFNYIKKIEIEAKEKNKDDTQKIRDYLINHILEKNRIENDIYICCCNKCLNEGKIIILEDDENDGEYFKPPSCNHWKISNFYRFQFIESLKTWGAVRGLKKSQKSFKEILFERTQPSICITCGRFNKVRDQNGRGKDIKIDKELIYLYENESNNNDNENINSNNKKLKELVKSQEWINEKGEICGCNCSQKWYVIHNQSPEMRKQAKKIGLKTGAKHLTNYNKSKAHSYEIKNRFKNMSKEEKLKYGERLNYSRNLNYAKKNGFDSYEEFIQYRLNVAISLGFDSFEPLREKLRSCPNNLNFDEAVKFLEKREKEIEIKYKIFL